MPIEKHKLMSLCRKNCLEIPERASGYRVEVGDAIEDIYWAEREHSIKMTNIQQRLRSICEQLGDYCFENAEDEMA